MWILASTRLPSFMCTTHHLEPIPNVTDRRLLYHENTDRDIKCLCPSYIEQYVHRNYGRLYKGGKLSSARFRGLPVFGLFCKEGHYIGVREEYLSISLRYPPQGAAGVL